MAKRNRSSLISTNTARYTQQQGETEPYILPQDHIDLGNDLAESTEVLLEGARQQDLADGSIKFDFYKGYNYNAVTPHTGNPLTLDATDALPGAQAYIQWTPPSNANPFSFPVAVVNRIELFASLTLGAPNRILLTVLSAPTEAAPSTPFLVVGELIENTAIVPSSSLQPVKQNGVIRLHAKRQVFRLGGNAQLHVNTLNYHNAVIVYTGTNFSETVWMPGYNNSGNEADRPGPFFRVTFYVETGAITPGTGDLVMRLQFNPLDAIYNDELAGIPEDEVNVSGGGKFVSIPEGEMITLIRYQTGEPVDGVSSGYEWFVEDRRKLTIEEANITSIWRQEPFDTQVTLNLRRQRRFYISNATGPITIGGFSGGPIGGWDAVLEIVAIASGVTVGFDLDDDYWRDPAASLPIAVPNGSKLELTFTKRPGDLVTVTWKLYSASQVDQPPTYANIVLTGQYVGDTFLLTGDFQDPQNRQEDETNAGSQKDLLVFDSEALALDFIGNDGNPDNATSRVNGPIPVGATPAIEYVAQPGDNGKWLVGGFLAKALTGSNQTDTVWRFSAPRGPVAVAPSQVTHTPVHTSAHILQGFSATPWSNTWSIPFTSAGANRRVIVEVNGEYGGSSSITLTGMSGTFGGQALTVRAANYYNTAQRPFVFVLDLPEASVPANGNVSLVLNFPFTPQIVEVKVSYLTNASQAAPTQIQTGIWLGTESSVGWTPDNIVLPGPGMIFSSITTGSPNETILPANSQTIISENIHTYATSHTAKALVPAGTYDLEFNTNGTTGAGIQIGYLAA